MANIEQVDMEKVEKELEEVLVSWVGFPPDDVPRWVDWDTAITLIKEEVIQPLIEQAERRGYFKGYDHSSKIHTEIINYAAVDQAKREVAREIDKGLREIFEPTIPMSIEYEKYHKFMSRYLGNKGGRE